MRFLLRQLRCNHQLHLACLHLEAARRQHGVLRHNPFIEEVLLARAAGLTFVQASDMRTDASSCLSNRRLSKQLQTGSHESDLGIQAVDPKHSARHSLPSSAGQKPPYAFSFIGLRLSVQSMCSPT